MNSKGNVFILAVRLHGFNQTWQPDISGRALGLYGLTLRIEHVFIVCVAVYLKDNVLWLTAFGEHVGSVSEMISFGNVCVIINNFHMTPHCTVDISAHFLLCSWSRRRQVCMGHSPGSDHSLLFNQSGFKGTISRV